MLWWSPVERGVLPLDGLRVALAAPARAPDFEIRVDTAFDEVLAACADPARDSGWIDRDIAAAYTRLHELGWAHSVETWRDGGSWAGCTASPSAGCSPVSRCSTACRDASKVALVGLVDLLARRHADGRLLDVQWQTPHLASLGVVEVPRATYLDRLERRALAAAAVRLHPAVTRGYGRSTPGVPRGKRPQLVGSASPIGCVRSPAAAARCR